MRIRMATPASTAQGAHKFSSLLLKEMDKSVRIVPWWEDAPCDATLVRGGVAPSQIQRIKKMGEKLVMWYGGWDLSLPNSVLSLRNTIKQASGVIYNSQFGMEAVHKNVGVGSKEAVIHNGSKMGQRADLQDKICMVACDNYDQPDKRRALIAATEAVSILKKYHECSLWVLGKISAKGRCADRVFGHIDDPDKLSNIRSRASVLIHMVKDDQCPNTVVESLGQGIPVLCHAHSGTPEIVDRFGYSLPDMDPEDMAIKTALLWDAGRQWQDSLLDYFKRELSIEVVAKRYLEFIEEIL